MISEYLINCFRQLKSKSVDYCVLRDYENLPLKFNNDIDILVDQRLLDQTRCDGKQGLEP